MEAPKFEKKLMVDCADLLEAFGDQLEPDVIERHARFQKGRDKYGVLVPLLNIERFTEAQQGPVRARPGS